MKKISLKLIFPILLLTVFFSSCTKEDIDVAPTPVEEVDTELVQDILDRNTLGVFASASADDCECYGPFDMIDWENTPEEDVIAEVEAALAAMSEEEVIALFTPVCTEDGGFYPNACFAECEGVTDYSDCVFDDLGDGDDEWGCDGENLEFLSCYTLEYPVTVVFADGSTVEVNSEDEYFTAIITAGAEPEIVYPFSLTNIETGETFTVNNEEELAGLSFDCFDDWDNEPGGGGNGGDNELDCIVNTFPMTITINGEAFTANDEEELNTIFEDLDPWSGGGDLMIQLGYPTTLTFENGAVVEVNNDQEYFDAVEENCD